MNVMDLLMPAAGLVIRSKEVELLVMQGRKVTSCLRVPIEGSEPLHLIQAIQKAVATSGLKIGKLAVSIQSRDVLFRFFTMPVVPKAEWDTAVQFEARKYSPFKTESLIWDYRVMRSQGSNQMEVIFSAIPKESFQGMQEVFAAAGIQPVLVEPRSMSLARLVESAKGRPSNEFMCLVDVDQDTAHLAIVKNHIPYLTRDVSLPPSASQATPSEGTTAIPESPAGGEPDRAADPRAQRFLSELNVSLGFFLREYPSTTIPRVLLCGDERLIGPWCHWLSDQLHCTVELGTSLLAHRVQGGLPLSFASAVGLLEALRGSGGASLDFLKRSLTQGGGATPQRVAGGLGSILSRNAMLTKLLDALKTPRAAIVAVAAVGFIGLCWFGASMTVSNEQRELDQFVKARPEAAWGLHQMAENELTPIQAKAQAQIAFLKQIVDQRMSVAAKLDALAHSLPDGVWLTELTLDDLLDASGKSQPKLKVNGACFLGEAGRELTAIQQFEEQVKRNRTFSAGFTEARLDRIGAAEAAKADRQYTYRTFQLSCTAGRKL